VRQRAVSPAALAAPAATAAAEGLRLYVRAGPRAIAVAPSGIGVKNKTQRGRQGVLATVVRLGTGARAIAVAPSGIGTLKNKTERGREVVLATVVPSMPRNGRGSQSVYVCMYVKIRRHQHARVHAHTGPRRAAPCQSSGVSQTFAI